MSDGWKSKMENLLGELSKHVKDMPSSSMSTESSTNDAEEMTSEPDEGDPGTNDQHSAEGDSDPFKGSHDRHVSVDDSEGSDQDGSDAVEESSQAGGGDDKEKKKAMLRAIFNKHS